jgi:methylated-DNA-[protein]-cysteine S-methyltransferase
VGLNAQKVERHHPILGEAERQLSEYFAGKRTHFELPLEPQGTEFQKKVWGRLRKIPFGKTRSYLQIARAIGSPRACRAVGGATGKNPLSIVIPCHRVIGANGTLTGFGGGLETKAKLLALEAHGSESMPT